MTDALTDIGVRVPAFIKPLASGGVKIIIHIDCDWIYELITGILWDKDKPGWGRFNYYYEPDNDEKPFELSITIERPTEDK